MNKQTIDIKGMHCNSCEMLIEDEVKQIPGVKRCKVNYRKGRAEIIYDGRLDMQRVQVAVEEAGYSLGKDEKHFFSHNPKDYQDLALAGAAVFVVFNLASWFGIFDLGSKTGGSYNSLPVVFLIGLTAGISTCMAIVGGLVLGASARFAEKNPRATTIQKFKPHLFFNIGRIASYFILGGVIGYLGSFLQLSGSFLGILTITVGIVMLLLGVQLTQIIPGLNRFKITMPKQVSRIFGIQQKSSQEYSHKNSAIMGALTFFLPCGFTQAMQLYAISTGNPVVGALTMGTFAIGTAPGLLGIGGLTSIVKGAFAKQFFRFAGVVVIMLAFFNISNGFNLTGFNANSVLPAAGSAQAKSDSPVKDPNVEVKGGYQIIKMTQDGSGYTPNNFTIQKNIPVKWIITSTDPYSCAASILIPEFQIAKALNKGENIINFMPEKTGTIRFTCNMGMLSGEFNVIEPEEPTASQTPIPPTPSKSSAPTVEQAQADTQVISATYSLDNDVQPNEFKVIANQPVKFEINSLDDGLGCMGSIVVIGLTEPISFQKGKTTELEFTPKPGKYTIACAMGVPRGEIIAE